MKKYLITLAVVAGLLLGGCNTKELSGTELLEQGSYEAAVEKFEEAIDAGRNIEEAYRGLGIAYWEMEDYQRARGAFSKALNNGAEETGTIYNFLGVCDLKMGYMENALEWFDKGLETEGNSEEMIREMEFNQIAAYEGLEDWDKVREKLDSYLAKYPDDEQAQKEADFLETR